MKPTWVGAGSGTASTSGNISPPLPTGWMPNDIWLMEFEQSPVNNFGVLPVGWVLVPGCQLKPASAATDPAFQIAWRRAQEGDTFPTISGTPNHNSAVINGFRGCIPYGNPWNVISTGTSTTSVVTGSMTGATTTVRDCIVALFFGAGTDTDSAQFSGWTDPVLLNVTERSDFFTSNGNGGGAGMASGDMPFAGTYGTSQVILATASTQAWCTIALMPDTRKFNRASVVGST